MESRGVLKIYKFTYKKFKAQMAVDVANVYEYLWVVEVGKPSGNPVRELVVPL